MLPTSLRQTCALPQVTSLSTLFGPCDPLPDTPAPSPDRAPNVRPERPGAEGNASTYRHDCVLSTGCRIRAHLRRKTGDTGRGAIPLPVWVRAVSRVEFVDFDGTGGAFEGVSAA
jgi:hypothetical protein